MFEQLKIYACDEAGNQIDSRSFTLQVNPNTISIENKNVYSNNSGMGSISSDQQFSRSEPASISFKTLLDGTGALGSPRINVQDTINAIKDICYNYQGDKHEPNKIILLWGSFYFRGCLNKLNISYQYFSSVGNLLRAELDMGFGEFKSKEEESKEKNQQSPDITHVVNVRAGDRLPLLCKRIYGNSKLFPEIARINGLTDFRHIADNTRLIFPPLK